MRRVISIFLIIALFLSVSLPVCAESKLAQFEQLLVGEWKQVDGFDFHDRNNREHYNFLAIRQFQYPAPTTAYSLDNSPFPTKEFVDVIYNAFLTEDATGQIYLAIQYDSPRYVSCIGSISFSEDGNILIIFPIIGESAGIYERIR